MLYKITCLHDSLHENTFLSYPHYGMDMVVRHQSVVVQRKASKSVWTTSSSKLLPLRYRYSVICS